MPDRSPILLPTQLKQVFDRLLELNLNPREFRWNHSTGDYSTLEHYPSGFYLRIIRRGHFEAEFSPGNSQVVDKVGGTNWDYILKSVVSAWATFLMREIRVPNVWSALAAETIQGAASGEVDNRPFTEEEAQRLRVQLSEIRTYVVEVLQARDETIRRFDANIEYLEEATGRLGRFDWNGLAISLLLSIAFSAPEVQQNAKGFFDFAIGRIAAATDFVVGFLN